MVMHEMAQGFDSQGLTLRRGCIGKVMLAQEAESAVDPMIEPDRA